jgi:ligand-binding SRPBCC domain-containing protein
VTANPGWASARYRIVVDDTMLAPGPTKKVRTMKEFRIDQTQYFTEPRDEVFAFFADAGNLSRITPRWLKFEIRSPQPVTMERGATINYTIRLHGIPLKWRSEITAWEPPFRFIDEQRVGPYRYWIHEHRFEERGGVTVVSDHVRYAVLGGTVVQKLFVARDIDKIFAYRRETMAEIFTEVREPRAAVV